MCKPLLLVDVDGVISLFGFDPAAPPAGHFQLVDGIAHYLSAAAGDHLRGLTRAFKLVWCTGWEEKAGEYLPRALGLEAEIEHVSFMDSPGRDGAHWKLSAIDAYAGPDRPLAWIDDAHDERCQRWAGTRGVPTLLVSTQPAIGLTSEHVHELLRFARAAQSKAPCRPAPERNC